MIAHRQNMTEIRDLSVVLGYNRRFLQRPVQRTLPCMAAMPPADGILSLSHIDFSMVGLFTAFTVLGSGDNVQSQHRAESGAV
ncbi:MULTISPECIES: hypothetical protein [Ralstonia solanacearum species complex]|uniref:hypothetical protein n=1 Tax=Ralstonia solanacearum species complex TaxID=3116862 RepID=UPI0015F8F684|nr:hypothetical protein [Ralstonia solanacearum]